MTIQFLITKYNMTTLEAITFAMWNSKGFVADGFDATLVKALRKIN